MDIKTVLVPIDFSPPSRLALNQGIAFARKFHARLTLLNVVETPPAFTYTWPADYAKIETQHRDQAWRMLSALVAPEDQDDLDLQIMVKAGNVEEEISSTILETKADAVVMGTHGRGLFGRTFIGSVTQHMLRKVPVPILTVCRVTRPLTFERMLYATDLSEASNQGFRSVLELASITRSTVAVLHAVHAPTLASVEAGMAGVDKRQLLDDAHMGLNALEAEASRQKIKIEALLLEGNPAEAILKAAEEDCADLIVMTVSKKGLIERALVGSTAERIIREAHLPVLSIPIGD
jgi:nucleotide-binding universal stress UspA family protein